MDGILAHRLDRDRKLINTELARILTFSSEVPRALTQAMRYAVLGPGKRIRPTLTLEAFRAAGGRAIRQVLPFCCGIELIHTFSLVHDDLPSMDNDDFRRGRPSTHRKFDEATAILAADGLFAYAFELFATGPAPESWKLEAIRVICRAVGPAGMTGGQALDIRSSRTLGGRRLVFLHRKKTAEFIAGALVTGAVIAGARHNVREGLWEAGLALGALFQITDDLLDAEQASDKGHPTMVSAYGRPGALLRAQKTAATAMRALAALGPRYRPLSDLTGLILNRRA